MKQVASSTKLRDHIMQSSKTKANNDFVVSYERCRPRQNVGGGI